MPSLLRVTFKTGNDVDRRNVCARRRSCGSRITIKYVATESCTDMVTCGWTIMQLLKAHNALEVRPKLALGHLVSLDMPLKNELD